MAGHGFSFLKEEGGRRKEEWGLISSIPPSSFFLPPSLSVAS
jgi:hypothetical protein